MDVQSRETESKIFEMACQKTDGPTLTVCFQGSQSHGYNSPIVVKLQPSSIHEPTPPISPLSMPAVISEKCTPFELLTKIHQNLDSYMRKCIPDPTFASPTGHRGFCIKKACPWIECPRTIWALNQKCICNDKNKSFLSFFFSFFLSF